MMSSKGLWRALRSPRLALGLIAVLGLFVLLSFLVPQRSVLTIAEYRQWSANNTALAAVSETLGADSVFTSWAFIATLVLLALNLVVCTYTRIIRSPHYPPRAPTSHPEGALVLPVADSRTQEPALAHFARGGWALDRHDEATWLLWRGRVGRAGSIALHVGLLLIMLGGIVSSMTRFSGAVVITEGQAIRDSPESYVEIRETPRLGNAFTGAELAMESIGFTYQGDVVSDAVARMRFVGRSGVERVEDVRVNYPLHLERKAYLLEKAGHAVAVRITDPAGQVAVSSIVNLGETGSDGSSDEVTWDNSVARLTLISDRQFEGKADPRKFELNDPVLYVDLEAPGTSDEAALAPGTSSQIGGWTVEFNDARLWNRFMVRADGGRWITFVSFAFVIVGMALRWFDPDAMVVIRRVGSNWVIWGRSRHGDIAFARQMQRVSDSLSRPHEPV